MGIDDGKINKLFQTMCPDAFVVCDIEEFCNRRVAIDAGIRIKKLAATTWKGMLSKLKSPLDEVPRYNYIKQLTHDLLMFTFGLMKRGISPVFCFDGERHPLKTATLEKRKKSKNSNREKAHEAIVEYESLNPLEITDDMDKNLFRKRAYDFYVSREEENQIMGTLMTLGIPCFRAQYEAEKLCASLSLENLVDAVFTTDTDCYALGVAVRISDHDFSSGTFDIVNLNVIIEHFAEVFECDLDTAFKNLVDLCIMSGCDFNEKMTRVASVTAFGLLKKHKSLDEISKIRDTSCLLIEECREIFEYENSGLYNYDLQIDWEEFDYNIGEVLESLDSHPLNAVARLIDKKKLVRVGENR